jgi:hypothetical protein
MSQVDQRPCSATSANVASLAGANASEVITFTGVSGKSHILELVVWSYSVAGAGRLTVESGLGNRILDIDIVAAGPDWLAPNLKANPGSDLIVTLFALAGSIGKLNAYKATRI